MNKLDEQRAASILRMAGIHPRDVTDAMKKMALKASIGCSFYEQAVAKFRQMMEARL